MTRTFFTGEPSEEERKVYELVRQAQAAAEALVKPGVRLCDIDAAARDLCYRFMIESYGDRPRTMIISTHLITEVEGLVEHAVVLDHGQVLESFDMNELAQRGRMLSGRPDRYGGTWPTMVCIRCRKPFSVAC